MKVLLYQFYQSDNGPAGASVLVSIEVLLNKLTHGIENGVILV